MIPLTGKVARFWKNDRWDMAHAFDDVIQFDRSPSGQTTEELYRG
jgi:hypothetical protein